MEIGTKTLEPIPTLSYVIEQRERPIPSQTFHYKASMSWTGKKSRILKLLQKTKLMERLGGLVFLMGIPLCLLGSILMTLSHTYPGSKGSDTTRIFNIIGPALMVLAIISFVLGCLLDGRYRQTRLPTISRIYSTNNDQRFFDRNKQRNPGLQTNAGHQFKQSCNIVLDVTDLERRSPVDVCITNKPTNLKGILKKPSNWSRTFRPDQATTKTVDFALSKNQEVDVVSLTGGRVSLTEKSEAKTWNTRLLSVAGLLLWAVSEKIKMIDSSSSIQAFSHRSKIKALEHHLKA